MIGIIIAVAGMLLLIGMPATMHAPESVATEDDRERRR